jgi:LDH2 family malate/lactate/ureidoglycolate dehydrogenase
MSKPEKVSISADALRTLVRDIFAALGTTADDAACIAEALVWANLRGVDSHGVSRLPRYVELFDKGEAKARPNMQIKRIRHSIVTIDADGAPGPVAMTRAVHEGIAVARESGIAWAAVSGTVHTGAMGYYTGLAAEAGMAAIGIVAGVPNMAYAGSRAAAVATSPISIAVPSGRHGHVILDMATAVVALGKIAQFKASGKPLQAGWALTEAGEPTTDPALAEIPLPVGGAKGAGLSLMFEMLTGVLLNNPIVSAFHGGTPAGRRHRQNGTLIVIDLGAFGDPAGFRARVDETLDALKKLPLAEGATEILYPGERGARSFKERSGKGLALPPGTWAQLQKAAAKLGVPVPAVSVAGT